MLCIGVLVLRTASEGRLRSPRTRGEVKKLGEVFDNAYRRSRPTGVRQGGARSADQAWRGCRRRLRRARKAGRQGRSVEGSGGGGQAAGLPAGLLQEAGSVGGIQRTHAPAPGLGLPR